MTDQAGVAAAPVLVGREPELSALARALSRTPAVVLVEGEAGIGKSRLLQEFLASPAANPGTALVATCPPLRESLTLGSVVDAIRQATSTVASLELSALAGALRPLFPEWAGDLPPSPEPLDDARVSRHRLFRALAELVEQLGVGVLVVEDAHWADQATVEFVLFLISRRQPINVIVTYRPEDVAAGSLLLRLTSRALTGTTHARLALLPLDPSGTNRLISSMLDGEPVSAEFTAFMQEHTAGVPLAVEESVRLLRDRADLVYHDGEWVRRSVGELQAPPTIRDAVLERLQRLSVPAQAVLAAAAVVDGPVTDAILREITSLPPGQLREGLTDALAAGLLREAGHSHYGFRHSLMGQAVYQAIPAPERRQLHQTAGRLLEAASPVPVAQLTRHFREAGDTARWCRYAEQAADQAIASGDHATATVLLYDAAAAPGLSPEVVRRGPVSPDLQPLGVVRRDPWRVLRAA